MLKVVTLIGTRPELIKLSRIIAKLDACSDHTLIHTGQNFDYELNQIFFEQLEIRSPDRYLDAAGETAAKTIGKVISRVDEALAEISPDAFLCLGDTNSCLAVLAAKRRKIPSFHMEAGNRCYDQRVPEEINRRIVDHTSDVNLTYTEHARRALLGEGLRPDLVMKTGSPMAEVIAHYTSGIDRSDVLTQLGLEGKRFVLVSAHREENVDDPERLLTLISSLGELAEVFDLDIIFSTHPRTRKRLASLVPALPERLRFVKPLGFLDYIRLQREAFCVVSDSGTLTEEASLLKIPAVMIREAHERPEGMDCGALIMCSPRSGKLVESVRIVTDQAQRGYRSLVVEDYDVPDVSDKVVRIIASYVDYVNRVVWHR
jgi:UDP-N-acetylglucosamine 2-epimerase (non-hydrolysing)